MDKRRDVRDVVNAINVYISNDAMYTDVHTGWEWNMNVVSKNQELLKEAWKYGKFEQFLRLEKVE